MRYNIYKAIISALKPLIYLWLRIRLMRGKESKSRFRERFGFASTTRPNGTLLWIHAASVGEVNSVLLFIEQIQSRFSDVNILLTTGTLTSAQLIAKLNPKKVIHQFVPVDTPEATNRFLNHWQPDIGFWVESELWPNLVINAKERGCFMVIINGRMSVKSCDSWQKYASSMINKMLNCFEQVFAQSEDDAQRFRKLGAKDVRYVGNLKYDADPLLCKEADLFVMQQEIGARPLWLAASTHANEEEQLVKTHQILATTHPDLLTIIAPRHPQRGAEIAKLLSMYGKVALRSLDHKITPDVKFYIADTIGELGLFYRLCEIVFMGGSLIEHGGQNPLEAARLRCCILTGTHTENFSDMFAEMENLSIAIRIKNTSELAAQIDKLMKDSDAIVKMQMLTKEWLRTKSGTIDRIIDILTPVFISARKR
ncbi:MAG: 3-deoxy-D-manno-octulosonic acid transferase [Rickettsiales bacterium]|jgi:3-deoxy-D-manno-octulosonic-acid transferase